MPATINVPVRSKPRSKSDAMDPEDHKKLKPTPWRAKDVLLFVALLTISALVGFFLRSKLTGDGQCAAPGVTEGSETWADIWQRKGTPQKEPKTVDDLLLVDGYDHTGNTILERDPCRNVNSVAGHDPSDSPPIIHLVRSMKDLWGIQTKFCDTTIFMGSIHYLENEEELVQTMAAARRITKGNIYCLDVRYGDKEAYEAKRKAAGMEQSNHLLVRPGFWDGYPQTKITPLVDMLKVDVARAEEIYYNAPFAYAVLVPPKSASDIKSP